VSQVKLGLNAITIRQADLETGLRVAKDAGFVGYEPWVSDLQALTPGHRMEVKKLQDRLGVRWLPLMGIQGFGVALNATELTRKGEHILLLAKEMGIHAVTVVPGEVGEDREITVDRASEELRHLAARAASLGVGLFFEMVSFPKRPFNTLAQAKALAERCGVKLVLDTFHLAVSRATLREIEHLDPHIIGLIHLSDAIVQGRELSELQDEDRVLPGEGELGCEVCGQGGISTFNRGVEGSWLEVKDEGEHGAERWSDRAWYNRALTFARSFGACPRV